MDTRVARRAAEKAARDLINDRAALVGELGVASAEQGQLTENVAAAAARGRQLIADAQAEAARLVAAAQHLAQAGEHRYAATYSAATASGWAAADLSALGFQANGSPRRPRAASGQHHESAPATVAVPAQVAHADRQSTPTPSE